MSNEGLSALYIAAAEGHIDVVQYLLNHTHDD